jgi:hypothetical protein
VFARCALGVAFSGVTSILDVVTIIQMWRLAAKCDRDEDRCTTDYNEYDGAGYRVSKSVVWDFRGWAVVATTVLVLEAMAEAAVRATFQLSSNASVAHQAGVVAADVASLGLYKKSSKVVEIYRNMSNWLAQEASVQELYTSKLPEIGKCGVMVVVQATILVRDSAARGKGDEWTATPSFTMVASVLVSMVLAAHTAAGFIWFCMPSAWSGHQGIHGSTNGSPAADSDAPPAALISKPNTASQGSKHDALLAPVWSWLRSPMPLLAVYQLLALYITVMVYAFVALHLWASLGDANLTFLVLLARSAWHLANLWAACYRHGCRASVWGSCVWRALLSGFTFVPWTLPGSAKWGLTFWANLLESTLFAVVGNAVLLVIHRKPVAPTDVDYSVKNGSPYTLIALCVSFVVPVGGVYFQWRLGRDVQPQQVQGKGGDAGLRAGVPLSAV